MPCTPARHHVVELPPHEVAVHALVRRHVAGQDAGLVVDAVGGAVRFIRDGIGRVGVVGVGGGADRADHPRGKHVERVVHAQVPRSRPARAGAPLARHPADQVDALPLEPVDHVQAGGRVPRMVGVVEPEAPDAHDRLAVLPGVGRRCRVRRHLACPVGHDLRLHVRPASDVVHDVELAPVGLGGGAHLGRHRVPGRSLGCVRVEPLQRRGVTAVLLHPQEVRVHRRLVVRRKQGGGGTVVQVGVGGLVRLGVLLHIGPRLDGVVGRRGRLRPVLAPVPPPVDRGAVADAGEPPLVANGYLSDDVAGWAGSLRRRRPGGCRGSGGGSGDRGSRAEEEGPAGQVHLFSDKGRADLRVPLRAKIATPRAYL